MKRIFFFIAALILISGCQTNPEEKHFCISQNTTDRIMCAEFYQKVCGYSKDGNTSQEFGNGCHACRTPEIEYWIYGKC